MSDSDEWELLDDAICDMLMCADHQHWKRRHFESLLDKYRALREKHEPKPRCMVCRGTGYETVKFGDNRINGHLMQNCPHGCVPPALMNVGPFTVTDS